MNPDFELPSTHSASLPIPAINMQAFLCSDPFSNWPNKGQPTAPSKPALVHGGTGASVTHARLKLDSLKIARSLRAIMGEPIKFVGGNGETAPIHATSKTVLLHLPNTISFPVLLLGGVAALYTVSPISFLLTPREIAHVLAKARPQVLFTTSGAEGEGKLRSALQILLESPAETAESVSAEEIKSWASELAKSWDEGKSLSFQRGDAQPLKEQRVFIVDLSCDYYGSQFNKDPRDWSSLLLPPKGHKHAGTSDHIERLPFEVEEMSAEEQKRRISILLWSSGTTGKSKGVLISHLSFVANAIAVWNMTHWSQKDGGERWVGLAPWSHIYGLAAILIPCIASGSTMILPPSGRFDLSVYLKLLTQHKATWGHIAPPVAVAIRNTPLLNDPKSNGIDLSSVRGWVSGGAPVAVEVCRAVYERTGSTLRIGYGTTEVLSASETRASRLEGYSDLFDELGSCGNAVTGTTIRIRPLPGVTMEEVQHRHEEIIKESREKRARGLRAPNQPSFPGEVIIKSQALFSGYFNGISSSEKGNPVDLKLNEECFTKDGWYRSGDEGVIDKEGNLWITGRTKEIIKVKGFQVSPAELDDLYSKHPAVSDAACTGHYLDKEGTEVPVVFVQPRQTSILSNEAEQMKHIEEIHDWIQAQGLAYYKIPRIYVVVAAIPKSPSGKIVRKDLGKVEGKRHFVAVKRSSKL